MPIYRPRAVRYSVDLDADVMDDSITVFEDDDAEPTGILDARGHELWRHRDRVPMGFVRSRS